MPTAIAVTVPVESRPGCLSGTWGCTPSRQSVEGSFDFGMTHTPWALRTMIHPQRVHLVAGVVMIVPLLSTTTTVVASNGTDRRSLGDAAAVVDLPRSRWKIHRSDGL